MTSEAGHMGMPSAQRQTRFRIMIEGGRNPAHDIVTIGAMRFPVASQELPVVRVGVAPLALLRSPLVARLRCRCRFMALPTGHRAVRPLQGKVRLGVVEFADLRPAFNRVTDFTSQRGAVPPLSCHAIVELPVVGILVARRTAAILETERQDMVRPPAHSHFVTIGAGHRSVRAIQRKPRIPVLGNRVCGAVPVRNRVAALALIVVRRRRELIIVGVLVAISAHREFHFVNRVFARGNVTLRAFHVGVFPSQRVLRGVMLLRPKQ